MASVALGFHLIALFAGSALASPTPTSSYSRRQEITQMDASQIDTFAPYTHFASAGYCEPSSTLTWTCGANCDANPDFIPVASGGDGGDVQFWYVGYSPSLASVVVAHQGTDPSEIEALLADGDVIFDTLDENLFPGVSPDIQVHGGFRDAQAETAGPILDAVTKTLADNDANSVTLVGHSLGAALSLLDAMYLPLHLPDPVYRFVGYGMPRVGNQEFADYMDAAYGDQLTRINNKQDPIPIIPGQFLGYRHPSGEVHIVERDSDVWNICPGQDNESDGCTVGDVDTIFAGDLEDHGGPYDEISMGC